MLKKLFVIILFGMSTIFSGDPKSDKKSNVIVFAGRNEVLLRDENGWHLPQCGAPYCYHGTPCVLSKRVESLLKNKHGEDITEEYQKASNFRYRGDHIVWEILAQRQKIDGRKFEQFLDPFFIDFDLDENGDIVDRRYFWRDHPAHSKDNMLRLCTLRQRPDGTKLLAPSWDDVAIEPIFSQYQTVASSDLSLKHSINLLKLILIFDRQFERFRENCHMGTNYDIKTVKGQKLIQANWSDMIHLLASPAESLLINDTLDAETRDKLSKSGLFVAQIYTELLKKRPKEVDGVKIMFTSEQQSS